MPPKYVITDGVLTKWIGTETVIHVPQGVQSIGEGCFAGRRDIRCVVLPASVMEIQKDAFSCCSSLREMHFSLRLLAIRDGAFRGCEALESVSLPWSLRFLGWFAFADCISLKEVKLPSHLDDLGEGCFSGCRMLTDVRLPDSIERLGDAFSRCVSLQSVKLPLGLKVLGAGAFDGCASLDTIRLPNTVERIGSNAFRGCTSLRVVELSKRLEEIPDGAFANCTSLQEMILPRSVMAIGSLAFRGAVVRNMVFPPRLERLEDDAFAGARFQDWTLSRQILMTHGKRLGNISVQRLFVTDMGITELPGKMQAAGTRGFARAYRMRLRIPEPFRSDNLADIARRPFFVYDDPEVLSLIFQEHMLTLEQARQLVDIASKRQLTEVVARVLNYIQESFSEEERQEMNRKQLELD